jgi:DNA-binding NtrC family response regulator
MEFRTQSIRDHLPRLEAGVAMVLTGDQRGVGVRVGGAPLLVGSSAEAGLRLADPRVSRRHCEVALAGPGFVVRDLSSRNGTWFDGSRIKEVILAPGSLLKVGDTQLVLRAGESASAPRAVETNHFPALVGHGPAMQRVHRALRSASQMSSNVVLIGETGTGKTAAARALHDASQRRSGPFETFDCSAVVPTLIGAELFGVVKGAFTDAHETRPGAFERAHHGTLFLDEITELPLESQAALLTVCEARQVTPVGGRKPLSVDVGLVAATRTELAEAVVAGRFREDLYYRLEVLRVAMPPLRARLEDLPVLCDELLSRLGVAQRGPIEGRNLALLESYAWPGNVRELRNVLERAVAQSPEGSSFAELDIRLGPGGAMEPDERLASFQAHKKGVIDRFERQYLQRLLTEHAGNIRAAARAASLERTQLKRLLRKHGLLAGTAD